MDYLFTTFGKYLLITAVVLLMPASIEARLPARASGKSLIAAYGVFAKLICCVLLLVVVFFALALASVERASVLSRICIFSMLGIPTVFLVIETFGKKVEIEGDRIIRSYFGVIVKARTRSSVVRVTYDKALSMFRVYFEDRSTLWISTVMRGSSQLAEKLNEKTA